MTPFTDLRISWYVFRNHIAVTSRIYLFVVLLVCILFSLQWLFSIDELVQVVLGDSGLSFIDRVDFLLDGFINIFRFINDFIPISMILISLFQAVALTLLITFRTTKKVRRQQALPIGLSAVGVGCVACGGSILTPLLGLVATNVSVSAAESVSTALLLIALVLSYISMNKVAHIVATRSRKT